MPKAIEPGDFVYYYDGKRGGVGGQVIQTEKTRTGLAPGCVDIRYIWMDGPLVHDTLVRDVSPERGAGVFPYYRLATPDDLE